MEEVDIAAVKELRNRTGAGIMDCKTALIETKGNMEEAIKFLRKKGIELADKKIGRVTKEGKIGAYIHGEGRIGVLVELNCESDFVAKTEDFQYLLKEIAMQVAAFKPLYVSRKDVPLKIIEEEKAIYKEQAEKSGKPPAVLEKIAEGKLEKLFFKNVCLLEQPYIRDDKITVEALIKQYIGKLGENIQVRRFVRFELGGE